MKRVAKQGWIKLHRQILDCSIWTSKEPFDKRSAWIDLLLMANHADKKIMIDNQTVTVSRGSYMYSIEKMCVRWMWSRGKVKRFLDVLESEHMINTERTNKGTLITIVNYSVFQHSEKLDGLADGLADEPADRLPDRLADEPPDGLADGLQNKNIRIKECKDIVIVSKDTICQTEAVRRVAEEWNKLEEFGIAPVRKIANGSLRYKMLVARIKEYSVDDAIRAIGNIKNSKFLLGRSDSRRQWIVTFDWFVRPNNFIKVLEGQYNDVKSNITYSVKSTTDKQLEELANRQKQDEVIMSDEEINRMLGE